MIKLYISLFIFVLCLISCNNDKSKLDDYYTEITNKELKDAIVEYDSIIKKEETGSYIIKVNSESMGDTLVKYNIMYELSPARWDVFPILYVANVNGKDVIFKSRSTSTPNNIVCLNKKIENELVRRNFPKIYEQYIAGKPYTSIEMCDGYSYQLIYYKGKLIYKAVKVGRIHLAIIARLISEKKIQVDENGVKYNIDIDKYFEYLK